jgi:hypothetical protein
LTVRFRKYACALFERARAMRHDDAATAGSAKMALVRLATVSQFSMVISGLPTFTLCSTVAVANWLICGTPFTRSSPRPPPPRQFDSSVGDEPRPEIAPPVERTHPSGKALALLVVWPKLGPPCVETKNAAAKNARWMQ